MEQVSRLPEMERPSPYNTDLVVSALFTQWKCPAMIRFGITVLLIIGGVSLLSFSNLPSEPNNYHLILPTAAATEAVTAEATQAIFPMLTSVTHNADWTPVEQDFDGVTMVLVPAGCFDMGSDDGRDEEKPVNRQCFDEPFWIDTYEVTQAQFTLFGGMQANESRFTGDDRPVEKITWFEARDFCALRDARLPSEREWEYAVRGPDNLVYSWGDEWDGTRAVWAYHFDNQTADVGSLPAGVSWVGALDMIGNVWEWVGSIYMDYPYERDDGREANLDELGIYHGMRGGAWNIYNIVLMRASFRNGNDPVSVLDDVGFRCARDYE